MALGRRSARFRADRPPHGRSEVAPVSTVAQTEQVQVSGFLAGYEQSLYLEGFFEPMIRIVRFEGLTQEWPPECGSGSYTRRMAAGHVVRRITHE